jgi:predicted Zn-dependent protease
MNELSERVADAVERANEYLTSNEETKPNLEYSPAVIRELIQQMEEVNNEYLKYFNLHHTLAVNEAGLKGICCEALGLEHYQYSLYELVKILTGTLTDIKAELKERDIHLLSRYCWCDPLVETP